MDDTGAEVIDLATHLQAMPSDVKRGPAALPVGAALLSALGFHRSMPNWCADEENQSCINSSHDISYAWYVSMNINGYWFHLLREWAMCFSRVGPSSLVEVFLVRSGFCFQEPGFSFEHLPVRFSIFSHHSLFFQFCLLLLVSILECCFRMLLVAIWSVSFQFFQSMFWVPSCACAVSYPRIDLIWENTYKINKAGWHLWFLQMFPEIGPVFSQYWGFHGDAEGVIWSEPRGKVTRQFYFRNSARCTILHIYIYTYLHIYLYLSIYIYILSVWFYINCPWIEIHWSVQTNVVRSLHMLVLYIVQIDL